MKNQVQLIGNIGKSAELTAQTKDGSPVVRFSLAQDASGMDGKTRKLVRKDPQWFQISCFGSLAERALSLSKGDLVAISGELKSTSYESSAGDRRTSVEVVARTLYRIEPLRKAPGGRAWAEDRDDTPAAVGCPGESGESL